jgi:nucleolar complex protein 2
VYDSDDLDQDVEKLKTSDPEFYKYLKECDKNLEKMAQSNDNDNVSGSNEDDDDDYDEDDVEGIKSEKLHKPPVNLEVSDVAVFLICIVRLRILILIKNSC